MGKAVEQTDPFMELLTDALRAGPGSPEWHQAVGELRKQGRADAADEYRLLWTARERLASGKEYRSVKAGAGFTRKVMEGIERLPVAGARKGRPVSVATVIALASVLVLVGVIAVVGYWMYGAGGGRGPAKEDLSSMVFERTALGQDFREGIGADWRTIGALPVTAGDEGLRPAGAAVAGADYVGGGVVTAAPVSEGGEAFAVEVRVEGKIGDGVIPQVFVTDRPEFSADRGTGSHELVWTVQDGQAQVVLPDGRVAGGREAVGGRGGVTTVRVVVGRDSALVETDGRQLWAGAHGLGAARYVGVRFLEKGGAKGEVVIKSVRVQKAGEGR